MTNNVVKCPICHKDKFEREMILGVLYTGKHLDTKVQFGTQISKYKVDFLPTSEKICKSCVAKERRETAGLYILILMLSILLLIFGSIYDKEWMVGFGVAGIIGSTFESLRMLFFKSDDYFADMSDRKSVV